MGTFTIFRIEASESTHPRLYRLPPPDCLKTVRSRRSNSNRLFFGPLEVQKRAAQKESAQPRRATIVTPATFPRPRKRIAKDAWRAERAAFKHANPTFLKELQARPMLANLSLSTLPNARGAELPGDCQALEDANRVLQPNLRRRSQAAADIFDSSPEERDREIERLKMLLPKHSKRRVS